MTLRRIPGISLDADSGAEFDCAACRLFCNRYRGAMAVGLRKEFHTLQNLLP